MSVRANRPGYKLQHRDYRLGQSHRILRLAHCLCHEWLGSESRGLSHRSDDLEVYHEAVQRVPHLMAGRSGGGIEIRLPVRVLGP